MFKFYKDFVERMLLCLLYLEGNSRDWTKIKEYSLKTWYKGPFDSSPESYNLHRHVKKILDYGNLEDASTTKMREYLVAQINRKDRVEDSNREGNLIDLVVKTLKLPHAKNILAGSNINRLRDAILLNDEQVELREILRRELSCMRCGHTFRSGEMSTVFHSEGGGVEVYCTNCVIPEVVTCDKPGCNVTIGLDSGFEKRLKKLKSTCDCHAEVATTAAPVTAEVPTFDQAFQQYAYGYAGESRPPPIRNDPDTEVLAGAGTAFPEPIDVGAARTNWTSITQRLRSTPDFINQFITIPVTVPAYDGTGTNRTAEVAPDDPELVAEPFYEDEDDN